MAARDTKAMAGVAAAAVALGVTQLLAAFVGPEADSRTAVGSTVIDLTPGPVKEWAIQTFGTADKLVLSVLVLAVIAVIAAVTGTVGDAPRSRSAARRSSSPGWPDVRRCCPARGRRWWTSCPRVVGTACGVVVLRLLTSGRFTDDARRTGRTGRSRRLPIAAGGCPW